MSRLFKPKGYKICPRCENKCLIAQQQCEECGLIFSRLQHASNKKAKKKLAKFDKDFVIYTNQYPSDINYWKLLIYSLVFGLFGGHYYYCGKFVKGGLMSFGFVYLLFCTIFNNYLVEYMETMYLFFPIGIYALAWMISVVFIATKRFKVPVALDLPRDKEVQK